MRDLSIQDCGLGNHNYAPDRTHAGCLVGG